ncbi:MAG: SAM-dependent methyltransferase, partial [Campylobacter sp.]|nr:SAM-dependent methyltransferase [Campylobacter sp.]
MSELIQKEWDYTKHAQFYSYRPNYAGDAIDVLVAWSKGAKIVADI